MAQAWGICPVCGKAISLDPVEIPGEPTEMVEHLRTHSAAPAAPHPARPPGTAPASPPAKDPHPSRTPPPHRPHARPRHGPG